MTDTATTIPTFEYVVNSRVETLGLNGEVRYMLHGLLSMTGKTGEGQQFAMGFSREHWRTIELGQTIRFQLMLDSQDGHILDFTNESVSGEEF